MKYAIIADIHANLPALKVVLEDIRAQQCTHTACLGDIVGYIKQPKECLDIIRSMAIPCVKGNHDEYCSHDTSLEGFNAHAAAAVEWTREQLTGDDRQWLRELPYVTEVEGFTLVHATLDAPQRWGYVFDKLAAAASFPHQTTPLCFFGHTHVPVVFIKDSVVRSGTYSKFQVESGSKYFINVGSVGQSRDGINKATYVIYDLTSQTVELRRLDYPQGDSANGDKDGPKIPVPETPRTPPPLSAEASRPIK